MPAKKKGFSASYLAGVAQNASQSTILQEQASEAQEQVEADVQQAVAEGSIIWCDIALLDDNPHQPPGRVVIDDDLRTLGNDMRVNGFLTEYAIPTRVSPHDPTRRQMVSGHRRKAAAQLAGLKQVPIIVKPYTDLQMLLLNLKENLFRVQLSPLDEAFSYQSMLEARDETGKRLYTQDKIAEEIGKSRGYVRNRLDLLTMDKEIQALVREHPNTLRAAYYLQEIEDKTLQAEIIGMLSRTEITGEQVSGYVAAWREKQKQELQVAAITAETAVLAEESVVEQEEEPRASGGSPDQAPLTGGTQTPEVAWTVEPVQERTGSVQAPASLTVPVVPRSSQTVLERGKQQSVELLAVSQLKAARKKLTDYASSLAGRTPGQAEREHLQAILEQIRALISS